MKASKFTEARIAFVLKPADEGPAVAEIGRKAGISEATFSNWRKRYGVTMPSGVRKRRQIDERTPSWKGSSWTCPWTRRCCTTRFRIAATQRQWFKRAAGTLRPACRRQLVDEVRASSKVSIRRPGRP